MRKSLNYQALNIDPTKYISLTNDVLGWQNKRGLEAVTESMMCGRKIVQISKDVTACQQEGLRN